MIEKIDDDSYKSGKTFFVMGGSIRSVFEKINGAGVTSKDENKAMSFTLGFADALLDKLRKL